MEVDGDGAVLGETVVGAEGVVAIAVGGVAERVGMGAAVNVVALGAGVVAMLVEVAVGGDVGVADGAGADVVAAGDWIG